MKQHDEATRQFYYLAHLETIDGHDWTSLHLTGEDAERQLKAVGAAWGVGFSLTANPPMGFGVTPSRESRCSDRRSPARLRTSR